MLPAVVVKQVRFFVEEAIEQAEGGGGRAQGDYVGVLVLASVAGGRTRSELQRERWNRRRGRRGAVKIGSTLSHRCVHLGVVEEEEALGVNSARPVRGGNRAMCARRMNTMSLYWTWRGRASTSTQALGA